MKIDNIIMNQGIFFTDIKLFEQKDKISVLTYREPISPNYLAMKKYIVIIIFWLFYSGMLCNQAFAQVIQTGDALPDNWGFANIGTPRGNTPTLFDYNSNLGTYYVYHAGGGDTGWGTEDNCCMIYFTTQLDQEVVVRVLTYANHYCNFNPKVFCMIRSSLEPEASMAYLELRTDGAAIPVYRPTDGFNVGSSQAQNGYRYTPPLAGTWMKFIRQGAFVSAFQSKDGLTWTNVGSPRQIVFRDVAYMGVGVAGCCGAAEATFDNLVVRDIQIPYALKDTIADRTLAVGQTTTLDITGVFGHYLGDYFIVNAVSTDPSVANVKAYQIPNPDFNTNGGDQNLQKLDITGVKDGIVAMKLNVNIFGYKMAYNFVVTVNGIHKAEPITPMDPSPWIFNDLGITANPSLLEFTNSVNNRVKILSTHAGGLGADTITGLYKYFPRTSSLGLIAYIDTVKNSGKGSFAGFMLRDTFAAGCPFVSFTAGDYEGLNFSYRWDQNVGITNIVDNSITLPCWLLLNYSTDNQNNSHFYPYYSFDSIYWQPFLKYPLLLNFSKPNISAGLVITGGTKATSNYPAVAVIKDFTINQQTFGKIPLVGSLDSLKTPMILSPNPVTDHATINFNVVQPGNVYLAVYDVYGILKDVLLSEYRNIGKYSIDYNPVKLKRQGIYLLKLISNGDYQTIKFIYQ